MSQLLKSSPKVSLGCYCVTNKWLLTEIDAANKDLPIDRSTIRINNKKYKINE